MRKTFALLLAIIFIISLIPFSYASDDMAKYGRESNILSNIWYTFWPFATSGQDPAEDADVYGWYKGANFGLINAEREVCINKLRTDVTNSRDIDDSGESVLIYTTTVTATAKKGGGFNNSFIYQASWYIRPFGGDADYQVYFINSKNNNKKVVNDWKTASQYTGDSGYYADYLEDGYNKLILVYNSSGASHEFKTPVAGAK